MKATKNSLCSLWGELVDWEKRKSGEGEFFTRILSANGCSTVLDAALGDGYQSLDLLKQGFRVTSNEINPDYEKMARANAKARGVELNITRLNWLELSKLNKKFDAITCLGNSICLLKDKKGIVRALQEMHSLLNDNGILIIDQRNFDYILDERPLRENFRFSKNYAYCGESMDAYPTTITNTKVVFEYKHKKHGVVGTLDLFPFRTNEMLEMLKQAGFSKVRSFGDYRENKFDNVDFIQHVAKK